MNKEVVSKVLIATLVLSGVGVFSARATDYTSSNFIVRDSVIGAFGTFSTSTSFELTDSGSGSEIGLATSTNFELRSGFVYFDTFTGQSQNWRWYDDADAVTPTTSLAAENTAPSGVHNGNEIRLRMTIKELAGVAGTNIKFQLQFSTSSDFSTGSLNVIASSSCGGTSRWCYIDGGGADNASITSSTLSDADSCSGGSGNGCGTHNEDATSTSSYDPTKNASAEYDFAIKPNGAEQDITYFFRAYNVNATSAVPLGNGESYPSIQIAGAALTFTIAGLGSGVSTEGVTTDAATTATTIPFGELNIGTETEAAQRMTITTSAQNGYQIFAFERQEFLGSGSIAIPEVTGSNASPSAWSTGCQASAKGCYGYHAGDDSLANSSTRFSANDTYAAFTGTTAEIAFDSAAVTTSTIDMVYKVEVSNIQESGDYSTDVVYIIVPTF